MFSAIGFCDSHAALVLSQSTNNIYAGLCPLSAPIRAASPRDDVWVTNSTPIRFDEQLLLMFFSRDGTVPILVPCNNRVFIRFTMHDATGKEVERTTEGRLRGKDVRQFPQKPGMNVFDKMASYSAVAGPDTKGFEGWPGGLSLPTPNDLFIMRGSGTYDLTIQIHLMKQHVLGTNNWTWDHIAIPPVTIKVEKPPEKLQKEAPR